jgi:hypothetical protein
MQEETNSIVYQRTQNGWSKMSIYTLKLWPKHETDYEISCNSGISGRRKRGKLRRWVVSVCECVWCPSLLCGFASRSVREVWSCLCMTHMKQTPGDPTDTLSLLRDATRTSSLPTSDCNRIFRGWKGKWQAHNQ